MSAYAVTRAYHFSAAHRLASDRFSDEENARRMGELEAVCLFAGWPHYRGSGVGRDGAWPPEPSYLIVGVGEAEAVEVARHFGQNAIVVGHLGEPARLVWAG